MDMIPDLVNRLVSTLLLFRYNQSTCVTRGLPLFFRVHWQVALVRSLMYSSRTLFPTGHDLLMSTSGGADLVGGYYRKIDKLQDFKRYY